MIDTKPLNTTDFANSKYDLPALYEDVVIDTKPLKTIPAPKTTHCDSVQIRLTKALMMNYGIGFLNYVKQGEENEGNHISRKKRLTALEFDEIKKHFDVSITKAAKKMNAGLTLLKRRCSELNILRWPHRKLKSLETLINNIKVCLIVGLNCR